MKLRGYQEEAVTAILKEFEDNQSTLLVLPTGAGKTQCFVEVADRMHHARVCVLAHREELIWQAQDRFRSLGIHTDVEMGDFRASTWNKSPVVISTVQSHIAGRNGVGRMEKFDPYEFGLVIVDEAHHSTAKSYRKVLDHYKQNPNIKILGVTATPDRADEQALGQIYETVAYDYEILDAINDGYLVPIKQQFIVVEGLDYSHIRTTAGDLNGADLAEVMETEANLQGIASSAIEIIGEKKALVFAASVKHAEMLSDIFNRHRKDMSDWVAGFTPKEERREKLQKFSRGFRQVMVNVGVLSEGYDEVSIEVIVQGRPTKSRCLYGQQIGRGTRPLKGVIDGKEDAESRIAAIALSEKPSVLVLDFVGNSGKHKLISSADILGGKIPEEVIEAAVKKALKNDEPVRMDKLLVEVQAEIEERRRKEIARKAKVVARASYSTTFVDPFDLLGMNVSAPRGWDAGKHLSEKQISLLKKQGVDPSSMPYAQASQLIRVLFQRWNNKLSTMKQIKLLKKRGIDAVNMPYADASKQISLIAEKEGWKNRN
jgi:superfamily II DNA or RNA helicase